MAAIKTFTINAEQYFIDTALLSFEEQGKYITLLSYMHQNGRMTDEAVTLLVGSISCYLKDKFKIDDTGKWYHERIEKDVEKKASLLAISKANGSLGGRPKKASNENNWQKNHPIH